jgi:predicted alpha/beta hydrolase
VNAIAPTRDDPAAGAAGREVSVTALDGRVLAATLYEPATPPAADAPITVVAGGAGIQRRFFGRFAAYLAERGRPALTFDYRDIGGSRQGSLRGSRVLMRDWCLLDVPGAIDWARKTYPQRPIHWVGHSMGGFATGLAPNGHLIARQLNVATLSGYWGRMASPERYRVLVLMGYASPAIVWAMGYLPGVLMGGEDMPARAFLEWRGWCMQPEFLFGDPTLAETGNFPNFKAPLRVAQISDDPWGTEAAVGHMTAHYTGSADRSMWRIAPADAGVAKIGHFGFFRPEMRGTLWREAAAWLEAPGRGT